MDTNKKRYNRLKATLALHQVKNKELAEQLQVSETDRFEVVYELQSTIYSSALRDRDVFAGACSGIAGTD